MEKELAKTKKELDLHQQFRLPFVLDASKINVKSKEDGITEDLLAFAKEKLVEGFSKNEKVRDVTEYVKDQFDVK